MNSAPELVLPKAVGRQQRIEGITATPIETGKDNWRQVNFLPAHDWAARHGFTLFPDAGYESLTLTCVNNGAKPGGRVVDVAKLQKLTKDQGFLIDGGYGKIKGTTFRISNMGDETEGTMKQLFAALDKSLGQL